MLSQKDLEGVERPVTYFSKKLPPRETRYSSIEKELDDYARSEVFCCLPDRKPVSN